MKVGTQNTYRLSRIRTSITKGSTGSSVINFEAPNCLEVFCTYARPPLLRTTRIVAVFLREGRIILFVSRTVQ